MGDCFVPRSDISFGLLEKTFLDSYSVSHVLNNTRFVSEDVRECVKSAIHELSYRPNALARSLRNGKTHTFGLILQKSVTPLNQRLLRLGIVSFCTPEEGSSHRRMSFGAW
jgi:hypothetical protein